MGLEDLVGKKGTPQPVAVAGVVKKAPASLSGTLTVVVPSHSRIRAELVRRWMPRGTDLPAAGDDCLLVFDETDEPWLVAWSPSS